VKKNLKFKIIFYLQTHVVHSGRKAVRRTAGMERSKPNFTVLNVSKGYQYITLLVSSDSDPMQIFFRKFFIRTTCNCINCVTVSEIILALHSTLHPEPLQCDANDYWGGGSFGYILRHGPRDSHRSAVRWPPKPRQKRYEIHNL
jgi:hypothetical protein